MGQVVRSCNNILVQEREIEKEREREREGERGREGESTNNHFLACQFHSSLFFLLQSGNAFRKPKGTYRFSHQQLEKEGVILETPGIPEQKYIILHTKSCTN